MALDDTQVAQFLKYLDLLVYWNDRAGLTAITRPVDIVRLHFVDSLLCLKAPFAPNSVIMDVGSGAGFPGIPLKIARPDVSLTLLESARRKAAFLDRVAADLRLEMRIVHGRAEVVGHQSEWRETFDVATARAVAPFPEVCELTLPLVRVGGRGVFLKGPRVADELDSGHRAITVLGGGPVQVIEAKLPEGQGRAVVVVPKIAPTPPAYPRRAGVLRRNPLA